jgi:hypothetical protein
MTILTLLSVGFLHGAETALTIKDYTGRGFAPDLIHYTLSSTMREASLSLTDSAGKEVPGKRFPSKSRPTAKNEPSPSSPAFPTTKKRVTP